MRRSILFLAMVCLWIGAAAQEPRWTVSILPGYQFNTQSYTKEYYCYRYEARYKSKKNFLGSVDASLSLSEHYGLHFGYLIDNGDYSRQDLYPGAGPPYKYHAPIAIWEIGPEWKLSLSQKALFYAQANFGRTTSSGHESYTNDCGYYWMRPVRDNEWVYGAAAGFRYFFLPNAGLSAQLAYHKINGWPNSDLWDVRLGATFRF